MTTETELYLVGDENSEKKNQWLCVTNCYAEACRVLDDEPTACKVKTIKVKPRRKGGRRQ